MIKEIGKGLRSGGWQANIEYFKDYVIKTPKTEEEIRKKISPYYESREGSKKVEGKIKKLKNDWNNSMEFVKAGKLPLKLLAFPEFLENGKIKQKRVEMLFEKFENLMSENKFDDAKRLVDRVIDFIINLWKYGIQELTLKFYSEMGLLDGEIVLVDLGELTDDKNEVKRIIQITKPLENLRRFHHDEVLDYYQEQIKRRLTLEKLEECWKTNL